MNHAKANQNWKALTSSPQPGTSFRRSDVLGKRMEYMTSQRWRTLPSFLRHPRTMIHGGAHRTRELFMFGTQWTTKIDKILWRNLRQRANGQYRKRGTKNGHQPCKRRASTSSSTYTKTSKRNAGVSRSRDGGGKETFES